METININATFVDKVTAAGSLTKNTVVPLTNWLSQDSSLPCIKRCLELNQATGEIVVKEAGSYLVAIGGSMTPTPTAYLSLVGGNGNTRNIPLDTVTSQTITMYLSKGVFKLVVGNIDVPYLFNPAAPYAVIVAMTELRAKEWR